jgi:WD40 repeat protein
VYLWESAAGRLIRTLPGNTSLAFSPAGDQLACGSGDGNEVRIWDVATGKEWFALRGHTGTVRGLGWSRDGRRILTASVDKTVAIWNAREGRKLLTYAEHIGTVSDAAFSPDGRRVASASEDETVRIWDAESGRTLHVLREHNNGVTSVAWSPDGKRLVSCCPNGLNRIIFWDPVTGEPVLSFDDTSGFPQGVVFSPDGRRLLSGSFGDSLRGDQILIRTIRETPQERRHRWGQ